MLPIAEGARTRRSARFGLSAEERTAINILDAVPVVVWIVLSFIYRLRRQAALALRKRALSCFQTLGTIKVACRCSRNHRNSSFAIAPSSFVPFRSRLLAIKTECYSSETFTESSTSAQPNTDSTKMALTPL